MQWKIGSSALTEESYMQRCGNSMKKQNKFYKLTHTAHK